MKIEQLKKLDKKLKNKFKFGRISTEANNVMKYFGEDEESMCFYVFVTEYLVSFNDFTLDNMIVAEFGECDGKVAYRIKKETCDHGKFLESEIFMENVENYKKINSAIYDVCKFLIEEFEEMGFINETRDWFY